MLVPKIFNNFRFIDCVFIQNKLHAIDLYSSILIGDSLFHSDCSSCEGLKNRNQKGGVVP